MFTRTSSVGSSSLSGFSLSSTTRPSKSVSASQVVPVLEQPSLVLSVKVGIYVYPPKLELLVVTSTYFYFIISRMFSIISAGVVRFREIEGKPAAM
jgi:hypothetical protein